MSILVDSPRWPWRGERWCHLVSDSDPDELHRFAAGLGIRRLLYQGDHYDLPASQFDRAVAAGAEVVDSRVIVRRLREAGLRDRRGPGWSLLIRWEAEGGGSPTAALAATTDLPSGLGGEVERLADELLGLVVLGGADQWGIGVTTTDTLLLPEPPRRWVTSGDGVVHVDWFVARGDVGSS